MDPAEAAHAHPPGTWLAARRAAERLVSPLNRILAIEAASGLLLMAATAAALIWANTAWASYHGLWHTTIGLSIGSWDFERELHFWVSDGLMTLFFFVVGLEIRREIHEGVLAELRRAALPLAAAVGGMVIPAGIYAVLNYGRAGAAGWAIPMATDIAFAVGILTLLGNRVPATLRILLLALAVIDDIGAVLVIAIFYTGGIELWGLVVTAIGLATVLALRAVAVRSPLAYVVPGLVMWGGLYAAGIHPTVGGVILGLLTPIRSWFGPAGFAAATQAHLSELGETVPREELLVRLTAIERARREAVSPSERLLHGFHPWIAFGVMPLFALANAGVPIGGADLSGDGLYIFLGIVVGLAIGKPLGIYAASIASTATGMATKPDDTTRPGILLVGMVGGIGFTMSLFIANLALPPGPMLDTAKLAILLGSFAASVGGLLFGLAALRRASSTADEVILDGDPGAAPAADD
jgi:Na+:H+ antiporter, NhaA family